MGTSMTMRPMILIAAVMTGRIAAMAAEAPLDEKPWREPGQIVTADYLASGALRYSAEGREIVGRNRTCFNNRPLYCEPPTGGVILAGDRPFVRFMGRGAFSAAIVRDGKGPWFHEYSEVESRYRCGQMRWRIADVALPGVGVILDVVPLKGDGGFALRLQARGLRAGDILIWSFGGTGPDGREHWDPIMRGNPDICKAGDPRKPLLKQGIVPQWSSGNRAIIEDQVFRLLADDKAATIAIGKCDRAGKLMVADASACGNPASLPGAVANNLPLLCGVIDMKAGEDEIFWAVESAPIKATARVAPDCRPRQGVRRRTGLCSIHRADTGGYAGRATRRRGRGRVSPDGCGLRP